MKPSSITLVPVTSSNVDAIGYHAPSRTLAIKFKGRDAVYHHANVPPETHQALIAADSIGSHYARHIKGKFAHVIAGQEGGAA